MEDKRRKREEKEEKKGKRGEKRKKEGEKEGEEKGGGESQGRRRQALYLEWHKWSLIPRTSRFGYKKTPGPGFWCQVRVKGLSHFAVRVRESIYPRTRYHFLRCRRQGTPGWEIKETLTLCCGRQGTIELRDCLQALNCRRP